MSLFILFISYCINAANLVLRGFALKLMWGWFMLSQFPQMPHISIAGALGLSCLLELFQFQGLSFTEFKQLEEHDADEFTMWTFKRSYWNTIGILIALGVGYAVHYFM